MSKSIVVATENLEEFVKTKDLEALQRSVDALARTDLSSAPDSDSRVALRKEVTQLWFALFAEIDRQIDPNFNPNEQNYLKLTPPRTGDVALPSGASPELISDPKIRKKYEDDLVENDTKLQAFSFQLKLRRIDETAMRYCVLFLQGAYSSSITDQQILSIALQPLSPLNRLRIDALREAGSGERK